MSTENTIDQKHNIVDSASITKTKSVENIEDAENMTMNITKRLAADFKALKYLMKHPLLKRQTISFRYEHQIEAIERIDTHLDQHFNEITNSKDSKLDDVVVLAASFVLICHVKILRSSVLQPEDLHVAEFLLTRSMILLKDKELSSKAVLTSIRTFHELGFVYTKLRDLKKSLQYLNKTLELYFAYTKGQDEFPAPINVETIVNIQVEDTDTILALDKVYMASLSTLMKLNTYEHEPIDIEKMATYMHKLLKKLLIIFKPLSINYTEWAFEAIHLAEYFLSCHRFIECKNHLCAASIMMIKCYDEMYMAINEKILTIDKDIIYRRFKTVVSIIDMIWVKYGLVILSLSRKRLLQKEEEDNLCEVNKSKIESTTESNKTFAELLMFTDTEENFKKFTYTMPNDYITNYADAKMLFVQILQLLNNLKVGEFASVSLEFGTEIAHYTSKAYKYLAFYEHDKVKQIKLQKRRVDVLEDYLKTLCTNDNLINCAFLWFELAVVYSTLINIKMENIELSELTAEDSVEINSLAKNSAYYFQLYLDIYTHTSPQVDNDNQFMFYFNLTNSKILAYADLYEKYV